jgi:nucleoside-diphosphate-sugar epimerase
LKVLITGSAGRIGRPLIEGLRARYDLRAFDRVATPGVADCRVGDVGRLEDLLEAADGVDVIVHLAGDPRPSASWEDVLQHNIIGTYNVFEAARQRRVRRVVFASRAGFLASYPAGILRTIDLLPRPESLYSVGKLFAEFLGQYYATSHGLEVIAVRVGYLGRERAEPEHPHHLSHGDAVRLFERCICHPDVKFEIVFGVSDSTYQLYDLEHGRRAIHYYPSDRSDWRPSILYRLIPRSAQRVLRGAARIALPSGLRNRLRKYWSRGIP